MRIRHLLLALAALSVSAFAEDKEVTVSSGGKAGIKLSVPKDAKITTKGEKTSIEAGHLWIYVWHVASAKTVADAVPHVADQIKGEFTGFTLGDTKPLTVAGHPAKHLFGKGAEADDGDPGSAEVVVFTDGKAVFAACVHGEKDEAAKERPDLLKLLKSAKAAE
jgi:hypothetical protein